jgi:hypothetical protein
LEEVQSLRLLWLSAGGLALGLAFRRHWLSSACAPGWQAFRRHWLSVGLWLG